MSPAGARRFQAPVYLVGVLRCVDVPAAVSKAFGPGRVAVRVRVRGAAPPRRRQNAVLKPSSNVRGGPTWPVGRPKLAEVIRPSGRPALKRLKTLNT